MSTIRRSAILVRLILRFFFPVHAIACTYSMSFCPHLHSHLNFAPAEASACLNENSSIWCRFLLLTEIAFIGYSIFTMSLGCLVSHFASWVHLLHCKAFVDICLSVTARTHRERSHPFHSQDALLDLVVDFANSLLVFPNLLLHVGSFITFIMLGGLHSIFYVLSSVEFLKSLFQIRSESVCQWAVSRSSSRMLQRSGGRGQKHHITTMVKSTEPST